MSFQFITDQVKQQQQLSLFRSRTLISEQKGSNIVVNGKKYLNFSSNDYLGLNQHPDITNALVEGAERFAKPIK